MPTRLRQIALVANNLESTVSTLTTTLDTTVIERDRGVAKFGLHNALLQLGDTFLEIVSPLPNVDPETTAGGRYLSKFGEGGYMVLMQVDDLHEVEKNLSTLQTIHSGGKSREYVSRKHSPHQKVPLEGITGTHYHPRDMGCIIEATESSPKHEWLWAGNEWYKNDPLGSSTRCGCIARVEIATKNPNEISRQWENNLSLTRRNKTSNSLWTDDGSEITFRKPLHGGENGPVAIDIFSRSISLLNVSTVVCGVVFKFVPNKNSKL
tara:strand:- start:426 stop:1220 length:795 start_codon:yes stop_codon:yes gene_type:complete